MGVLSIVLLVLFVIVSVALIFLIAVQDENSNGLGSIFGGSSDSTFGSGTSSFITKMTTILAVAFVVLALVSAVVNKSSSGSNLADMAESSSTSSWYEEGASK